MKVETAIKRIIESDKPPMIKKSRLYSLAFKCIAGSPNQKKVIAEIDKIPGGLVLI